MAVGGGGGQGTFMSAQTGHSCAGVGGGEGCRYLNGPVRSNRSSLQETVICGLDYLRKNNLKQLVDLYHDEWACFAEREFFGAKPKEILEAFHETGRQLAELWVIKKREWLKQVATCSCAQNIPLLHRPVPPEAKCVVAPGVSVSRGGLQPLGTANALQLCLFVFCEWSLQRACRGATDCGCMWPRVASAPPVQGAGGGEFGTRPQYPIVCLWRRLLASHHCSF